MLFEGRGIYQKSYDFSKHDVCDGNLSTYLIFNIFVFLKHNQQFSGGYLQLQSSGFSPSSAQEITEI